MIKTVFNILMITLVFGSQLAHGQECMPDSPLSAAASGHNEICPNETAAVMVAQTFAARELSAEELDQIVGEGQIGFIINDNSTKRSVAEIILWDEISTRSRASMATNVVINSGETFMQSVQVNSIIE